MERWHSTLDAIAIIGLVLALILGIGSSAIVSEPVLMFAVLSPSFGWLLWSAYRTRGETTSVRSVGQIVAFLLLVSIFFAYILGIFG